MAGTVEQWEPELALAGVLVLVMVYCAVSETQRGEFVWVKSAAFQCF